ncbi:hypothetical protein ACJJTC_007179 [Scirpophaga incertulas]
MKAVPTSKSNTGKYIPAKDANTDDDVLWLKSNSEPWQEVIEKWQKTFPFRQNQTQGTVQEYLDKWEILKNCKGHTLINFDFEKLYMEKSLNFYKHWNTFFDKLFEFKKAQVTNEYALNLIDTLNGLVENDKKLPTQISLLAYLIPPKGRLSRKIKFSASEATEGLIVQTHNAGDIEQAINKQKEKAASRHQTVQPFVLLQGNLQDFSALYIVIDDIKYQLQSATKAFDLLFKSYHVLNAKYPDSAEYLYLIIQRKVYGITTRYDKIPPHIVEILNL